MLKSRFSCLSIRIGFSCSMVMVNPCTRLFKAVTGSPKFTICITLIKRAFLLKVTVTVLFIGVNVWYGGSFLSIWNKLEKRGLLFHPYHQPIQNTTRITTKSDSLFCTRFPEDVVLFDQMKTDTSFCCESCGLVSSSGRMTGSKAGNEIESNECIIRMNNAPTLGYEADVGSRTTFRVFSHTSVVDVKTLLRSHKSEENSTIFIAWGPDRNMKPQAVTHTHLKDMSRLFPKARIYTLSSGRVKNADDKFEYETGKNRLSSGAYLSTGWFTILFAKDVCREINIYGMVEEDYCTKVSNRLFSDTPYHYYKKGSSQCSTYKLHENTPRGGHRFFTEKRIYKKWAKEWNNTKFHHPEWAL